jgi:hypothetical protein
MIENPARDFCGEALASAGKPHDGAPSHDGTEQRGEATGERREDQWPIIHDAAYYGLAGDIVETFAPETEADPVAILVQTLTYFGNVIGRSSYYQVEADHHHANLFAVLVGQTAKGRKGTSGGRVRSVVQAADKAWTQERMKGGLSSGEGLISEVRDAVKKWDAKAGTYETVDPGVSDKRLMVIEPEFSNALAVMERAGNTLSPMIRKSWDGSDLSTMTKNSTLRATDPHISIVGHITADELRVRMTRTDAANGFANRFLFALVKRAQLLPHGGNLDETEIQRLGNHLKAAADFARDVGRVWMTEAAREQWEAVYPHLSAEQPGLLGAITARAEAQSIRLALIYGLLDCKDRIDVAHLKAALAVWEYCEASAAHIFGKSLGDPVADEIMRALRQAGNAGMTRTAIRDLFGRHQSNERVGAALALLVSNGRARMESITTGGRPAETWFATAR